MVFWLLLHTSTMSQTITDTIYDSMQLHIFLVSEVEYRFNGLGLSRTKGPFDFLAGLLEEHRAFHEI